MMPTHQSMHPPMQAMQDVQNAQPAQAQLGAQRRFWTAEEDNALQRAVHALGDNQWLAVASIVGTRNDWQCRERWCHHLKPGLKKDNWSREEDDKLLALVKEHGHKWTRFAAEFPQRPAATIKNRWHFLTKQPRAARKRNRSAPPRAQNVPASRQQAAPPAMSQPLPPPPVVHITPGPSSSEPEEHFTADLLSALNMSCLLPQLSSIIQNATSMPAAEADLAAMQNLLDILSAAADSNGIPTLHAPPAITTSGPPAIATSGPPAQPPFMATLTPGGGGLTLTPGAGAQLSSLAPNLRLPTPSPHFFTSLTWSELLELLPSTPATPAATRGTVNGSDVTIASTGPL